MDLESAIHTSVFLDLFAAVISLVFGLFMLYATTRVGNSKNKVFNLFFNLSLAILFLATSFYTGGRSKNSYSDGKKLVEAARKGEDISKYATLIAPLNDGTEIQYFFGGLIMKKTQSPFRAKDN